MVRIFLARITRNEDAYLDHGLNKDLTAVCQRLNITKINELYKMVLEKYFELMELQLLQKKTVSFG